MTNLYAYLVFNGNCMEAMNFYKECLQDSVLDIMKVGDSPMAADVPVENHNQVLHSSL